MNANSNKSHESKAPKGCEALGLRAGQPAGQVGLLEQRRTPLRPKDFASEVRAAMDVEQFAAQAELLLELRAASARNAIDSMLAKALESERLDTGAVDALRASIFVYDSSELLAHTIQEVRPAGAAKPAGLADGTPDALSRAGTDEQSWLCAVCNGAQLARRHMVIARLRRPLDMGESARRVRLLALVLAPSKEKSTKDGLETGRTFASLLSERELRAGLLEARTELEFRALMVARAQQLARAASLVNRHKYALDAALLDSVQEAAGETRAPQAAAPRATQPATFAHNPRTAALLALLGEAGQLGAGDKASAALTAACEQRRYGAELAFGRDAWEDFKRRLGFYASDFRDGLFGPARTLQKSAATTWFLYFGILLPTIAFSSLNSAQTNGQLGDMRKALIGQALGGLGFALLGGQPLVIIMTTAPLCLYTKVIHQMCLDYGFPFGAMYAAVGLWNGLFLLAYSLLGFSRLMKWCTRSTEEIFALFIVVAFITDASKDTIQNFHTFYYTPACEALGAAGLSAPDRLPATANHTQSVANSSRVSYRDIEQADPSSAVCRRDTSLLFVLLMLGTLWLSLTLYRFRHAAYLSAGARDLLADYALPSAVVLMSIVGSSVFGDIFETFVPTGDVHFERAAVELLPVSGLLVSLALGFTLSLLFFMDQNISAAMVNAPENRLKKGDAFHYDLLIIGLLNVCLTMFGLPMMHGVLPHSPLHARSLADVEQQVVEGHARQVVIHARETRITAIAAHLMLLGSLQLIPYPIAYIPRAVLNGLFLYMAITSLDGLQVFERIRLLFTEQCKYPPNHYIRRCPQRKIHQFTFIQLIQLLVMCLFGFSPINVIEMFFPVIILLMIPFRHKIVTRYMDDKCLDALDGNHS